MRVLVACEESQVVATAFRELGHEAYSCDILPCGGGHPEYHLQVDALELLKIRWDMILAFPPCTYLSNAGACRLYPTKGQLDMERFQKGLEAKAFFLRFWEADCPKIAIENPVSSRIFEMPPCTQEIQPYQFDDDGTWPYTKKTRLWLKGLPPLIPTTPDRKPIGPYVPSGTGRKNKRTYGAARRGQDAINRAKTPPGVARAMAQQWGGLLQGGQR